MRLLVNIDVPELNLAIDFYRAALGLRLNRIIDRDVAELVGGSSVIYLLAKPAGTSSTVWPGTSPTQEPVARRCYTRHWTPIHLDIVVDNIVQASRQAIAAGAVQESGCVEWCGSKCITFADPFGHGFCLIEFFDETYTEEKL